MTTIARRFLIRGRVQGVGFRWFVIHSAEPLDIAGWTRNLPDGGVEVFAQGRPAAIEVLAADLARGPRGARVDAVESVDLPSVPELASFTVRY